MGSVLTSMPFVAGLKERFPGCRITFLTDVANTDLVERCDLVDAVIGIAPSWRSRRALRLPGLAWRLRRAVPDIFFDLQLHAHRADSAWLAIASGASARVGFYWPSDTLRHRIFHTLVVVNMFAPVQELYLQMARMLGYGEAAAAQRVRLRVDADDRDDAAALLAGWPESGSRLLVVNVNTSDKATVRRWPLDRFRNAISRILEHDESVNVALIGAADEFDRVESLRQALGRSDARVRNVAGRTSFGGLLALIRRADCLLTNDSGPFHFGVALETPTVGLFGPVHPDHYARTGTSDRTVIFYHPIVCSPCVHFVKTPPCGGNNHCMQMIEPDEVADACLKLLSGAVGGAPRGGARWRFSVPPQTTSRAGAVLGVWNRQARDADLPVATCG